jgi:hypothetical protein
VPLSLERQCDRTLRPPQGLGWSEGQEGFGRGLTISFLGLIFILVTASL